MLGLLPDAVRSMGLHGAASSCITESATERIQ